MMHLHQHVNDAQQRKTIGVHLSHRTLRTRCGDERFSNGGDVTPPSEAEQQTVSLAYGQLMKVQRSARDRIYLYVNI